MTLIWWKDTNPDPKERHALRFVLAGAYGAGSLVIGLVSAIWSATHSHELREWIAAGIASGRLSFYVSATVFGFNLFKAAYDRKLSPAGGWQNCIFAAALLALGYGYNVGEPVPFLGLLSWSVFFLIGDWALIEQYVIDRKHILTLSHFLRIVVVNVVILTAWVLVMVHLWPQVHWLWYWFGVVSQALAAFVLWLGSVAWLSEFLSPAKGGSEKTPPSSKSS